MAMLTKVLYLSYDGMTDALGESQVLPYLIGLSNNGYHITLLSCEKPHKFAQNQSRIAARLAPHNITWEYLFFTSQPPFLAKIYDLWQLKRKAAALHQQQQFSFVHCRSYVPAFVGRYLQRRFKVPFLFDMRGFWVEERVEGGMWNLNNPIFKGVYHYYKRQEADLLEKANAIISLTEAAKTEIQNRKAYQRNNCPITVIPCCTDTNLFNLQTTAIKQSTRKELNIDDNALVISFLGAIGTWYMLPEMLRFFKRVQQHYPKAILFFITGESPSLIHKMAEKVKVSKKSLRICKAPRHKVPHYLAASDIHLFFIQQHKGNPITTLAHKARSPVKLSEALCMGLPVITNSGIGDVAAILQHTQGGLILNDFSETAFTQAIQKIPALQAKSPTVIRQKALPYYTLPKGIELYTKVYQQLLKINH